ncbi:MAG: hypothetical protein PF482_00750 [Desulfobacteraceae bacterium]|nr:hypothetical protein [Desulfobacteraceae bacterium]
MIRNVIAGCEVLIINESDSVMRGRHPVNRGFYAPHQKKSEIYNQIRIYLRSDPPPLNLGDTVFQADASWSISEDDSFKWIISHHPDFDHSQWTARFNHEFTEGIVYCGQTMLDRSESRTVLRNPVEYPLDQILMMHFLARNSGMLIHSAGWRLNDNGWIFAGKSGAGKSTISNLIVEETGTTFLSDDRIVVRKIGQDFLMYGTPWPGDAGYAVNESVPLKGILFLSKGAENNIRKLNPSDAIARLMPVVSIPWYDREKVELMMDFCDILIGSIPMYELAFVPDKAAVDMLVGFVSK